MKPTNSCPPVAELRGVGQVSDLPVPASLRARPPETQLSLDVSGEPEVPGTGGSETHPHICRPVRWQALILLKFEPRYLGCYGGDSLRQMADAR